jgi:hypothetical protein
MLGIIYPSNAEILYCYLRKGTAKLVVTMLLASVFMRSRQLVDGLTAIHNIFTPLLWPLHLQSPPLLVLDLTKLNTLQCREKLYACWPRFLGCILVRNLLVL